MAKKKQDNCYIYTRVSTEMQVDGYSLDAQKDRLYKAAAFRDLHIAGEYCDKGKSGKSIDGRDEFKQMLADIAAKKDNVTYVLVFKLSRFGRRTSDVLTSLEYIQQYGVNLWCVEDNIDSKGSAGKLMISILSSVAEIERENISAQTMAGRREKAREGLWNGGQAPYGYTLKYEEGAKTGKLMIDDKEAENVKLIYQKYLEGLGVNGVAKWMNEHGYRRTSRQNTTLKLFSGHFVTTVLDNPVYMGKIAYGRRGHEIVEGTRDTTKVVKKPKDSYTLYDGKHEAITSKDDWYKAQVKRSEHNTKSTKIYSLDHYHVLSGVLRCPVCGGPMYGSISRHKKPDGTFYKDKWYYRCKHKSGTDGHTCTYGKLIPEDEINDEVWKILREVLESREMEDRFNAAAGTDGHADDLRKEIERLKDIKRKTETKKAKIYQQIKDLDPDLPAYEAMLNDYSQMMNDYEDEIQKTEKQIETDEAYLDNAASAQTTVDALKARYRYGVKHMNTFSMKEQKEFVQELIESVEIYKESVNGRWVKSVNFRINMPDDIDPHNQSAPEDVSAYDKKQNTWTKGNTLKMSRF